jgi:hypothetical protein
MIKIQQIQISSLLLIGFQKTLLVPRPWQLMLNFIIY